MNDPTLILFYKEITDNDGNCFPSTRKTYFDTDSLACGVCPLRQTSGCDKNVALARAKILLYSFPNNILFDVLL